MASPTDCEYVNQVGGARRILDARRYGRAHCTSPGITELDRCTRKRLQIMAILFVAVFYPIVDAINIFDGPSMSPKLSAQLALLILSNLASFTLHMLHDL